MEEIIKDILSKDISYEQAKSIIKKIIRIAKNKEAEWEVRHSGYYGHCHPKNIREAFTWSLTREGFEFWEEISDIPKCTKWRNNG